MILILRSAAKIRAKTIIINEIVIVETIIVTIAVVKNHSCMKYLGPLREVITLRFAYFTCKNLIALLNNSMFIFSRENSLLSKFFINFTFIV